MFAPKSFATLTKELVAFSSKTNVPGCSATVGRCTSAAMVFRTGALATDD